MKKLLCILFSFLFFICNAHTAQIVNVEYIHNLISQEWDITVPYNPALSNVKSIANMKYLLTAIDVANEILNGEKTTNYGNGEFATTRIADTIATNQAVETLIKQNEIPAPEDVEYKFFLTTTSDTNSFSFSIIAAGEFYIDWGDGKTQLVTKTKAENITYSHNYKNTGRYTIKLGGQATEYIVTDEWCFEDDCVKETYLDDAIQFSPSTSKISSIDGSLGTIFSTLPDGTVPKFSYAFYGAENLTSVSPDLFSGITGTQEYMFASTFSGCSSLTSIPANLFANITGETMPDMFSGTFAECTSLTSVPAGLFAGIYGGPAESIFSYTFAGCTSLTSIPENLFGTLYGEPVYGMFDSTFAYCENLTGPSARINGKYLYEIWPDAEEYAVYGAYEGCTGLSDYACIPAIWGGLGDDCGSSLGNPAAPENAEYKFFLTTTDNTDVFSFSIAATGEFYIDWGDGKTEWVTQNNKTQKNYMHRYASTGAYTIGLGGYATEYDPNDFIATISFSSYGNYIASIDGSLATIFGTLTNGYQKQPRFYHTFSGASNMTGSIPENLFAGISGAPASNMFRATFSGCSGLTGSIPENLFAGISGAPADSMFYNTFEGCSGLTGAIPDGLFAGISGAPATSMFYSTFEGCSGLTGAIPDGLFAGISGAPATGMFSHTFSGCSGLTGAIPDGLFAGISGAPATGMFYSTFEGCSGLTGAIPDGLFAGISGAPATGMFSHTFSGCSGLTGAIPDGLFAGISGAPAKMMFAHTFSKCSGLTSIPENLFAGISGAPASDMFYYTFYGCSGLTGAIPDGLFAGISGAPAKMMFAHTFSKCSGLTSIPENLFAGISGAPAWYMFNSTFSKCSGLTSIPENLFAGISGAPADSMFNGTFYGCSGLTSIPENLFGNISGTAQRSMFSQTFYNCGLLTGPSARINGKYLYEIWPDATTDQVGDMYYHAKKLDDYRCIPTVWGGGGQTCAPTPEFTLTTMPDARDFSFYISAAGEFTVDWGDGTIETINKTDTNNQMYHHAYGTAGAYTIGLSGQATAYNPSAIVAAISFNTSSVYNTQKIASIDGSLGAIFGTLADGTQPRFYETFSGASNMTGSIPEKLFAGISGAPAVNMFRYTFYNCTSLTGPSARIDGRYLYEIWPDLSNGYVGAMYYNATGLSDYSLIPSVYKEEEGGLEI